MSDEQKDEIQEEKPEQKDEEPKKEEEKKYTDDDVDSIINKKFAKWKAETDKAIAEAKAEGEKLAKMNEDQKRQYEDQKRSEELKRLQDENAELKRQANRAELAKNAARILKESEIEATQDMLDFVVGEDAETTKANIEKFVGIIKSQLKAADVKRAKGTTPMAFHGSDEQPDVFAQHIARHRQ